ncbi:hypothetical protein BDW02DRAFT_508350, partial [Decorospora gaudefroyi]
VKPASDDRTVRVWETATGGCRSVLERLSTPVSAVVFSPDGRTLHTNAGDLSLPLDLAPFPPILQIQESSSLIVEGQWVLYQTQRFLWLPPEYRNCTTAVCRYIVSLGCTSGRVALLSYFKTKLS